MFREFYYSAVSGTDIRHDLIDDVSDEAHIKGYIGHMGHCFDYFRQSILCNGDLTPELVNKNGPHNGETMAIHQCRDWEKEIKWQS